jgi:hypothetical protein
MKRELAAHELCINDDDRIRPTDLLDRLSE